MSESLSGPPWVDNRPGFGFIPLDPHSLRAMHQGWRRAIRDMRNQVGGFGFIPTFTLGGGPGVGVGGPGRGRDGRRGRGRRGDVRAAILALLAERPMHGYEMIQEIGERSKGLWRPSPGSVYPTLQLLVDEGFIVETESDGSKRLFELTEEGRAAAAEAGRPPWEEIADGIAPDVFNLNAAWAQLATAFLQSAQAATTDQQKRIVDIVNAARRDIYGVLGED